MIVWDDFSKIRRLFGNQILGNQIQKSCDDPPSHLLHSIASLYNWRYRKLGSLPHVFTYPEYQLSNAGFEFDYQLINVENFNGVGESEPNPYFYQVSTFS